MLAPPRLRGGCDSQSRRKAIALAVTTRVTAPQRHDHRVLGAPPRAKAHMGLMP